MKVVYSNPPFKGVPVVATIGVFDGLHLGHGFIIEEVKKYAKKLKVASLVVTFDTHPRLFLIKNEDSCLSRLESKDQHRHLFPGILTSAKDKRDLIKEHKVDYLWILKTSTDLLNLSGQEFIHLIEKYFTIKLLIVGQDFRFGHSRRMDITHLQEMAKKDHFALKVINKLKYNKEIVSSSFIRKLIQEGDIAKASKLLTRNYFLSGRVKSGLGKGRELGFPTANLETNDYLVAASGVYAGYVELSGKRYLAAINIGRKPTIVDNHHVLVEAHILDFNKNILGRKLKIIFLQHLRPEKKFPSLKRLKEAIAKDIAYIRKKFS